MKKITGYTTGYLVFILCSLTACAQKKTDHSQISPPGYNLSQPETFTLPGILREISGITFNQGNSDTIFAQQDEKGSIFFFTPGAGKIQQIPFGKNGDYEDITILRQQVFVLKSNGNLYSFPLSSIAHNSAGPVREWENLVPEGEYESLSGTAADNQLYILCKSCKEDKKTTATSGYIFQLNTENEPVLKERFSIRHQQIEAFHSLNKKAFRPSALTWNNATREWFIISSVNKMLITVNASWQVTHVYPLDPAIFIQPEGIAFDNHRNLYISNEAGGKAGSGTILKFSFGQE